MRIQHNIAAMNAYRNYNTNTSAVSKNLEKLSSGYKINRAGDDAAGLAISEKMRAQISGLNAASKNVKDGISLVKTAEGAMQEVQDMLNRMVTLATQSANGTYDNEVDRLNLQKEVDQLRSEINRIADSSNFNGIKLLDGSQEIKTSYTNLSSPASAPDGMTIISDGQLGVDAQAGVFSYDLSQLKITVGGNNNPTVNPINPNAGDRAVSDPDWIEGTPASVAASKVTVAMATAGSTAVASFADLAAGDSVKITIDGKTYTFTAVASTASTGTATATSAKFALGSNAATNLQSALNSVLGAAEAAAKNANASFTKYTATLNVSGSGALQVTAHSATMKPAYTKGTTTTATLASNAVAIASSVKTAIGKGSSAVGTVSGTISVTVEGETVSLKVANASASGVDVVIATTATGSQALAKINAVLASKAAAINAEKKAAGGDYTEITTLRLDATGKVTAGTTPVKSNAPDAPSTNASQALASYTVTFGSASITLHLKPGEYSGADLAKEIANAINQAGNQQAGSGAGSAGGTTASQIMALAGGTQAPTGGTTWDGTLKGAAITASFNGSKLTITMDEPPKQPWDLDMTLKFSNGSGNGGEQFKPTVDVEPMDNTINRQYAQATIDLNKLAIKDGYSLQLGNTTYTFAIGSDSRFKNASNVVDLTDLTMKDFAAAGDRGFLTAANRLSKAAAANSTFLVGSDTKGGVSLTEKEGAIDYSVNNLAGSDNNGTAGEGTGIIDDPDTAANNANGVNSTFTDWKGLVKMGQASVSGDGLTLQIGDTSESYNQLVVNIGDIHTKALGIDGIDISTQGGAQTAVNQIRNAINTVSSIRGTLGATQNRLEHTANNLSVMTENIQDAESTIRDTDIAEEMMAYTKNNILVQSAQAMLAQANQIPQGVLQLLG